MKTMQMVLCIAVLAMLTAGFMSGQTETQPERCKNQCVVVYAIDSKGAMASVRQTMATDKVGLNPMLFTKIRNWDGDKYTAKTPFLKDSVWYLSPEDIATGPDMNEVKDFLAQGRPAAIKTESANIKKNEVADGSKTQASSMKNGSSEHEKQMQLWKADGDRLVLIFHKLGGIPKNIFDCKANPDAESLCQAYHIANDSAAQRADLENALKQLATLNLKVSEIDRENKRLIITFLFVLLLSSLFYKRKYFHSRILSLFGKDTQTPQSFLNLRPYETTASPAAPQTAIFIKAGTSADKRASLNALADDGTVELSAQEAWQNVPSPFGQASMTDSSWQDYEDGLREKIMSNFGVSITQFFIDKEFQDGKKVGLILAFRPYLDNAVSTSIRDLSKKVTPPVAFVPCGNANSHSGYGYWNFLKFGGIGINSENPVSRIHRRHAGKPRLTAVK